MLQVRRSLMRLMPSARSKNEFSAPKKSQLTHEMEGKKYILDLIETIIGF